MLALKKVAFCAALAFAISAGESAAAVIDTTGSDNDTIFPFGYVNTATYGQTFTVGGTDTKLNSFSLYLRDAFSESGSLDLRGYIAEWDGAKASSILYESSTATMNLNGVLQEFAFLPDIDLTFGQEYVAFLSISNLGVQSNSGFGMPYGGDAIPGHFVHLNNGTDFSQLTTTPWSQFHVGSNDVWFKADLSPVSVPEPASLALLGSGLLCLGFLRRRRDA